MNKFDSKKVSPRKQMAMGIKKATGPKALPSSQLAAWKNGSSK